MEKTKMRYKDKKELLLTYLKRGYTINNIVALRELAINSAQLYFLIYSLRKEGWGIRSAFKKSKYAPVSYKEYELDPNWRLASETQKREELAKSKKQSRTPKVLRAEDLRIGMLITDLCAKQNAKGKIVAIYADGYITYEDTQTGEYVDTLISKIKRV